MADRRGIVVPLLILAFIFLSPDPARPAARQLYTGRTLQDVIAEEQQSLAELGNSTYAPLSTPALNVTGLEDERGYAWDALPRVRDKARSQLEYALGDGHNDALALRQGENTRPIYQNVTGFLHGEWVRSELQSHPRVNLSDYATFGPFGPIAAVREFSRNFTGEDGAVRLRFHERHTRAVSASDENSSHNVTDLDMDLTLTDSSKEHNLRMHGVYFLDAGHAVLTTTSDKFAGIFLLPHLTLSDRMFEASRALLNRSISETIQRQVDGVLDKFNPWSTSLEGTPETAVAIPECELIIYLQQLPPTLPSSDGISPSILPMLEQELRFPTGASVPPAPDMRFSMLAFSPDCGYVLESKGPPARSPREADHLVGPKTEVLNKTTREHILLFAFILVVQLFLLKRQMREASTPSTQSRISLFSIAMLALGDGFIFMTFLLVSFFISGLWTTVMATAFVAFVCVSFFAMRFLLDIWTVQAPERARRRREEAEEDRRRMEMMEASLQRLREARDARVARARQPTENNEAPQTAHPEPGRPNVRPADITPIVPQSTNDTAPATTPASNPAPPNTAPQVPTGPLPLPVTAPRPNDTNPIPVFMPADQAGLEPIAIGATPFRTPIMTVRESFGAIYTRFYLLLLGILFLSLNAASWPGGLRRTYFTFLGFCYLSFWLPQINRNVQRNCRKALSWEFVVGQSVSRYLPFVYLYSYPDNIIFADQDYVSLAILGTWIWTQLLVLISQEIVGPRWFIRKDWAPPAYDYHPVLREDEEGSTMPIGFSQAVAAPPTSKSDPESPVAGRIPGLSSRRDSNAGQKGKRLFDCAICMQELEVLVVESGSSGDSLTGPAGLLARRLYMVTPCRHIFHSACLEGWMKYRLQCPICRETLPPL